jgi:hypothetical protein
MKQLGWYAWLFVYSVGIVGCGDDDGGSAATTMEMDDGSDDEPTARTCNVDGDKPCENASDCMAIVSGEMQAASPTCGFQCFGVEEGCDAPCLEEEAGLSAECAECQEPAFNCVAENCLAQCGGAGMEEQCSACIVENCSAEVSACNG